MVAKCAVRLKRAAPTLAALGCLVFVAGCGGSGGGASSRTASTASDRSPITIGIAAAKTGLFSAYDLEPGQALQMRAAELNASGGIDGRKVKIEWLDTRSDRGQSAADATQLLSNGAKIIVATCDFDFGSPAAIVAQRAGAVSFSLCAEDPKFADTRSIGDLAFSMGSGVDLSGSLSAEWTHARKKWDTTYVLGDTSIEYSKSLDKYFTARWNGLGGKIAGHDTFDGSQASLSIQAQLTRMKSSLKGVQFITVNSYLPALGTVVKQIRNAGIDLPIVAPGAAGEGKLLTDIAGPVSNVYLFPFACITVCTGEQNPKLDRFVADYKARYGKVPSSTFAILGYDLMSVLANGLQQTGGDTGGTRLAQAIVAAKPLGLLSGSLKFTAQCHKPARSHAVVEVSGGKERFVERYGAQSVPDIGTNNPCVR